MSVLHMSLFPKRKRVKNTCKHFVATLITKFKLPDDSMVLPQVAFTQNEVEYLLDKLNTNGKSQQIPKEAEKTTIIFRLLNSNQFLRQMKVIKTFKNGFLTNLLKKNMWNVVDVEVPCPRTSYMYTWVARIFHRIKPFLRKENFIFVGFGHALRKRLTWVTSKGHHVE